MKKVLVTGATGFIGACLVHRLVGQNCEVHVLTREKSNKWRIKDLIPDLIIEHTADLRDKGRVASTIGTIRPNTVYHLATYGAYHFQRDPDETVETNIEGTLTLLDACSEVDVEHFIVAGSSSEYGIKDHPMKETDILEPVDLYGVTKATATLLCVLYAKQHDMPITVFRPFAVYGYYEEPSRLIPTAIRACLDGKNPKLLSPRSVRDFIFIDDVIDAILKIESAGEIARGQIYNVGCGKQYTVSYAVSKIIELTGAPIHPLWGLADRRDKREPTQWVSDVSKIKRDLAWWPKHDLELGLAKTIRWFKEYFHLYESADEGF